jgi:hypothetical protein
MVGFETCVVVIDNGEGKGIVDKMSATLVGPGPSVCPFMFDQPDSLTYHNFQGNFEVS